MTQALCAQEWQHSTTSYRRRKVFDSTGLLLLHHDVDVLKSCSILPLRELRALQTEQR